MAFFTPLAMSRLVELRTVSTIDPKTRSEMGNFFAPMAPIYKTISMEFTKPLIRQEPASLEKFIEENTTNFLEEFAKLMMATMGNAGPERFAHVVKLMGKIDIESILKAMRLPREVENNLLRVFELETNNAMYFMSKYGQLFASPDSMALFTTNDLDLGQMLTTSGHLYFSIMGLIDGIFAKDSKLTPTLTTLSKLAVRYAEEKDAQIMSLDIHLDEEKSKSLDEAYEEYRQRTVNQSA
ncbi:MAG: hypothetical protein JRN58_09950 [Nitrososphaerota archaeon]|nr:hypothetical protein [Nitrososphaerota archaeon]MDG6979389.1 hypothetical protein [Nitrososphaerota archaeon]